MVKLTLLARVADGLPLAEGLDNDSSGQGLDAYKTRAKQLFKKLSTGSTPPSRLTIETDDDFLMHYVIDKGVCYLTLCERTYPKKLAYAYLEELQREFDARHGASVDAAARPYAFIKFDTFIQRTKKLYQDARTSRNLTKLNDDLHDIQQIMTKNINEVMGQGERLERVSEMSGALSAESKKYSKKAKDLSRQALIQKYAPIAVFALIVFGTLMIRRWLNAFYYPSRAA